MKRIADEPAFVLHVMNADGSGEIERFSDRPLAGTESFVELEGREALLTTGPDGVHDLLLHLGDLNEEEVAARSPEDAVALGQLDVIGRRA